MSELDNFHLNQRLSYASALCTVRFLGAIPGTSGSWLGVEWDDSLRGKHSGTHNNVQYFTTRLPNAGSFIRPARAPDPSHTFLEALREKYASVEDVVGKPAISLSTNKVFEEVGFEKMAKKLADLKKLKIALLDGWGIDRANTREEIAETCPNIQELDLSRNRFESLQCIADIVSPLKHLTSLRISGNRFSSFELSDPTVFHKVTQLEISSLLATTEELAQLLSYFPNVHTLIAHHNSLAAIAEEIQWPPALTAVDLAHNSFTTLGALSPLAKLPELRTLLLSHNHLTELTTPTPFDGLTRLDVSFNMLRSLELLDALPASVPRLQNLRISHNPFESNASPEEVNMLCIARLSNGVSVLNHSAITFKERENAELWYLGRIATELAGKEGDAVKEVLKHHGRWAELCHLHGEPIIPSQAEDNDKTLRGSRLITIKVQEGEREWTKEIPRSTAVSTVRKIVAGLVGWKAYQTGLELRGPEAAETLELSDSRELGMLGLKKEGTLVVTKIEQ